MSMEAFFIVTYAGAIFAGLVITLAGYWIAEKAAGRGSWKEMRPKIKKAALVVLQVAYCWFTALGLALCIVVLYRAFFNHGKLPLWVAVAAYVAGVAGALPGPWVFERSGKK